MHWAGNWMMTNYRDTIENFDWGVTYMPREETRSSVLGGKFLSTFEEADHKEEAIDFIEFISSQEQNAKFNRESLFLSPRLDNSELDYEFGAEYFEIFSNELENSPNAASYDWANTEVMGQIENDIKDNIVYVLQDEITPEEAAEEIEELGNQEMD
ncbi:MAG: extracellular solute-binding protein, partial [Bacillota bacterium]